MGAIEVYMCMCTYVCNMPTYFCRTPNDTTILSGWRRVAFVEDFYQIIHDVHTKNLQGLASHQFHSSVCIVIANCQNHLTILLM